MAKAAKKGRKARQPNVAVRLFFKDSNSFVFGSTSDALATLIKRGTKARKALASVRFPSSTSQYTKLTVLERERYHKRRNEQEPRMRELVTNLNAAAPEIRELWKLCSSHWTYEDPVYRLWHGSFKVYSLQGYTLQIVAALQALLPKRQLNADFLDLIAAGTGKVFHRDVNKKWFASTRPIVETFFHARFMLEMAAKYARKFKTPPRSLPSGWAAFLYLYDLR